MINLRRSGARVKNLALLRIQSFLVLSLLSATLTVGCYEVTHPSDQAMEERLRLSQPDFDKLIDMLKEDSDVVRLGHSFAFFNQDSRRSLSTERMNEYGRLFDKLALRKGVHRDRSYVIRLIASSHDGIFIKSEKSYVYSTIELSPQVDSLDNIIKTDKGDHTPVFKKISNNWYLYYESW